MKTEIEQGVIETLHIPLEEIQTDSEQPRTLFDEDELNTLAENMRERGQLVPIRVERLAKVSVDGELYRLVNGERRFRAAQSLAWPQIRAEVWTPIEETKDRLLVQLDDNSQRVGLTALEEAEALNRLVDEGMNVEQIAQARGVSKEKVYSSLKLLEAMSDVQDALTAGKISAAHALVLARIEEQSHQYHCLQVAIAKNLSVRQLDEYVKDRLKRYAEAADDDNEQSGTTRPQSDGDVVEEAAADLEKSQNEKPFETRMEAPSGPVPDDEQAGKMLNTEDSKIELEVRKALAREIILECSWESSLLATLKQIIAREMSSLWEYDAEKFTQLCGLLKTDPDSIFKEVESASLKSLGEYMVAMEVAALIDDPVRADGELLRETADAADVDISKIEEAVKATAAGVTPKKTAKAKKAKAVKKSKAKPAAKKPVKQQAKKKSKKKK